MLAYHLGDMDLSIQKSKRYVPQNDHVHISHSEARKLEYVGLSQFWLLYGYTLYKHNVRLFQINSFVCIIDSLTSCSKTWIIK